MQQNRTFPCVVILTPLRIEYEAVRTHLSNLQVGEHPSGTFYESGLFQANNQIWHVILIETGAGNVGVAIEAERAMNYFHPRYIFLVGIAGGLKDVHLGDIVVATRIYGYESGKADISFQTRPDISIVSHQMIHRANMEGRRKDWLHLLPQRFLAEDPRVLTGPIAAGEKVINSTLSPTWRFLQANYSDALAVEMEGHGFLKAMYARQFLNALVIRGISDLIEGKNQADEAHFQEIAAHHASAFTFGLLARLSRTAPDQQPEWLKREPLSLSHSMPDADISLPARPQAQPDWGTLSALSYGETRTEVGSIYLKRGQVALFDHNYQLAQQCLSVAEEAISDQLYPEEVAQIKYLQALAYLEGQHIAHIPPLALQQAMQLIEQAIALHQTHSYLYTLALIKNAASPPPTWYQQVEDLKRQANLLTRTLKDEENIQLVKRCQGYLLHRLAPQSTQQKTN